MNKALNTPRYTRPLLRMELQHDYLQIMPKNPVISLNRPVFINISAIQQNAEGCRMHLQLPPFLEYHIINPQHPYFDVFCERMSQRQYSWQPSERNQGGVTCMGIFSDGAELVDNLINQGLLLSVVEGNFNTDFNCRLAFSGTEHWRWQ